MPGPEDQSERPTTPPTRSERTTPYGSETGTTIVPSNLDSLRPRYEIQAELGRGGMGIVYRARDRETEEVVALKVINPHIASDPAILERFRNELRLARKITHKNVCRMYELLRFEQIVVIAMEYVEGESLRSVLERYGGVPLRRGLECAQQMCDALAEAHGQGIIHRDLKPENILIDSRGEAKVMDFGIARSVEVARTDTGGVIGTPTYMSPEQAEGKPLDARSDIYALGLILHEMFTGQPVFQADTPAAVVHKHVYETPASPRSVEPMLPDFLEQVILKCLRKKPHERFQSVVALRGALETRGILEVTPEGVPVPPPRLSSWGPSDWGLLVLGVAALLYFLGYRNSIFPSSSMRLEVDAISARRTAEDLARQLSRPFPPGARSHLEVDTAVYQSRLYSSVDSDTKSLPSGMLPEVVRTDLPMRWRIQFGPDITPLDAMLAGSHPEQYADVDRKGSVQELSLLGYFESVPPLYHPATTEVRRDAARNAAEQVCGPLPAQAIITETSGGERQAHYTVSWRPVRSPLGGAVAEVSLVAERLAGVRCHLPPPDPEIPFVTGWLFQAASRLCLMFLLGGLMVHFGMGQCHRSPLLRKRLPLAVVTGLAGMWLLGRVIDKVPNSGMKGPPLSIYTLLVGGLALAGLMLACMVTVEHYLARRFAGKIAAYSLALQGKLGHPAVGLAMVRGALLGLLLVGVETLTIALAQLAASRPRRGPPFSTIFTLGMIDPLALGLAIESISPALFVLAAAIFDGLVVGLIFLGGSWCISAYKELKKYQGRRIHEAQVLGALVLFIAPLILASRLHFAQALGPALGFMLPILVISVFLVVAFALYDVLTLSFAVGTAVLWTLDYPLLQIFSEVGNGAQWALLVGWGAVVFLGVLVAFRTTTTEALRKMRSDFQ